MSSSDTQPLSNPEGSSSLENGDDQLPVYLDDDALESMTGETMEAGGESDSGDAARLATSDVVSGKKDKEIDKARRGGGIGWFKALVLFLFAQFLLLLILGSIFRKPLTQSYDRLVERGYIDPGSLPWQSGAKPSTSEAASVVGVVAWEDVRRRHELTLLADAAIARGDRGALDELRGVLDIAEDPAKRAAARAEMFRVQQMYATTRMVDVPLPLDQLYPGVQSEGDLSEQQIIDLLVDLDRESEIRIRAAWLLKGHHTLEANDELIRRVSKDKDLDVVKQAMLSFQSNTGYASGDWFDAKSAESWWIENASRLAKEFNGASINDPMPSIAVPTAEPTAVPDEPAVLRDAVDLDVPIEGQGADVTPSTPLPDPAASEAPAAEGGVPMKKDVRPIRGPINDARPSVTPAPAAELPTGSVE
jgi:hypothetical protein